MNIKSGLVNGAVIMKINELLHIVVVVMNKLRWQYESCVLMVCPNCNWMFVRSCGQFSRV